MVYPNNLKKTSVRSSLDQSAKDFFNNYMQPGFTVSSAINDIVIGHFEKIAESREAAEIMASAVIYTSLAQNVDPLAIIEKMNGMEEPDVAAYVNMFLNLNRVGSSYLGFHSAPTYKKYVKRTINPVSAVRFDGTTPERAAPSARYLKDVIGAITNTTYWIRGFDNTPMLAYCDMTGSEAGSSVGGWMRFDQALVSANRGRGIRDNLKNYIYANNGTYNAIPTESTVRGIRWDLGPNLKFSGARCQLIKFVSVGGQDGYAAVDAPVPTWAGARPNDLEVTNFIDSNVTLGSGTNVACFGVSTGNGLPGPSNLARLYKGRASSTEWPDQHVGNVTLSAGSFIQYDQRISNGRYVYYYESDSITEYNNLEQYRIWLR